MVVSGYTLYLYCDCDMCQHGRCDRQVVEISHELKSECYKIAYKAGWKFNRDKTLCIAPKHKKSW